MFEYETRGNIDLKGSPGPIDDLPPARRRLGAKPLRLPNGRGSQSVRRPRSGDRPLLGRWKIARGGRGQIVHVSGESGIGKSRLALALVERVGPEALGSCAGTAPAHLSDRRAATDRPRCPNSTQDHRVRARQPRRRRRTRRRRTSPVRATFAHSRGAEGVLRRAEESRARFLARLVASAVRIGAGRFVRSRTRSTNSSRGHAGIPPA